MMMMALGPYFFGLETAPYQSFERTAEYRHEEQPRIGRQPAMQYIGAGVHTVTLDGVIYPEFKGGLNQVRLMRLLAGVGRPLPLVDGTGVFWGLFVIVTVREKGEVFRANGTPRKMEFTLTLKTYGSDGQVS